MLKRSTLPDTNNIINKPESTVYNGKTFFLTFVYITYAVRRQTRSLRGKALFLNHGGSSNL